MASKELELSIAIGGVFNANLGKSIDQAKEALDSLSVAGTETQKKLSALGKIDANQLALEKLSVKLRDALIKEKAAAEKLAQAQTRSGKTQESLTRRKEAASVAAAKLLKQTQELSAKNIAYKKSVADLYGPIDKLRNSEEKLKKTREQLVALQKQQEKISAAVDKRTQMALGAQARMTMASNIAARLRTPLEAAMEGERLIFC